jgi:GH25 family lysozyme M1 (1,4-beta-N-acetylmuramidase)
LSERPGGIVAELRKRTLRNGGKSNCAVKKVQAMLERLEPRWLMARPLGLDTSHWQGTVNWTSVAGSGRVFGWTKATESTDYTDATYVTNVTQANNAGVHLQGYHFGRYDLDGTVAGAQAEAQHYLDVVGPYLQAGYMPPMLDVEHSESLTKTQLTDWVNAFCNYVLTNTGTRTVIYVGSSNSINNLNSSVTQWPLWVPYWNGQSPETGAPGGTGIWPTWQFWQYSSTESVPGVSGGCDVDVFNGTQGELQTWYIPAKPATPSPANNANVGTNTPVLDWADSTWATSYDVYVDNVFKANVTSSEWTSTSLTNATHTWKVLAKNNATGTTSGIASATWNLTVSSNLPRVPSNPTPANNAMLTVAPTKLDWSDSAGAASYVVYIGTSGTSFTTTLSEFNISPLDGIRPWRVKAVNASGEALGPQWTYTLDRVAPGASYGGESPTTGGATLDFTIVYSDAVSGVDVLTLDSSDITVTGPNGYSANATYVSYTPGGNGSTRTATYRITAPGGTWTAGDSGTYTFALNASAVKDVAGNFMAAQTIQSQMMNLSFAYKSGVALKVEFDSSGQPIRIGPGAGGGIDVTRGATTLNFTGVVSIQVAGSAGADSLLWAGPMTPTMTYAGNGGDDSFTVDGGTYTFNSNVKTWSAGGTMALRIRSGAVAIFNATEQVKSLVIEDGASATLSANGSRYVQAGTLSIAPDGKLDLNDNDLIVDGGSFASVTDSMVSGYSSSVDSTKRGIVSTSGQNVGGVTILALFDNALTGIDEWPPGSGNAISASAVVGKYTYFGDRDLDGQVTPQDYTAVDANLGSTVPAGLAWLYGDEDMDGTVTPQDYTAIDANLGLGVGAPLAAASLQMLMLEDRVRGDLVSA